MQLLAVRALIVKSPNEGAQSMMQKSNLLWMLARSLSSTRSQPGTCDNSMSAAARKTLPGASVRPSVSVRTRISDKLMSG